MCTKLKPRSNEVEPGGTRWGFALRKYIPIEEIIEGLHNILTWWPLEQVHVFVVDLIGNWSVFLDQTKAPKKYVLCLELGFKSPIDNNITRDEYATTGHN